MDKVTGNFVATIAKTETDARAIREVLNEMFPNIPFSTDKTGALIGSRNYRSGAEVPFSVMARVIAAATAARITIRKFRE